MSSFIPNSHTTPNAYCDRFMHLLTAEEWKVLSYFIRRIMGFDKKADRIALTQLAEGIVTVNKTTGARRRLDYGTGMGRTTNSRALKGLVQFGLIKELEPVDFAKRRAPLYALQINDTEVDMEGLEYRLEARRTGYAHRTSIARIGRAVKAHSDENDEDECIAYPGAGW